MNTKKLLGILAIFLTITLWGLSYSSTKVLLQSLEPAQIVFLRLVLASVLLGMIFFIARGKIVERRDLYRVILGGAFGYVLYFVFEHSGLQYTTAGAGSLIAATIPVTNMIVGVTLFHELHPLRRWLGVLLSFFGVYLIIHTSGNALFSLANKGNFLIFCGSCSWIVYTRINEPLLKKYNSLALSFQQSVVSMLLLGVIVVPGGINLSGLNLNVWLNLSYLGLICSAGAMFLYLYALKNVGSVICTTFCNLVPVFGILGGTIFLREALITGQLIGGIITILGVTIVTLTGDSTCHKKEDVVVSAEQLTKLL